MFTFCRPVSSRKRFEPFRDITTEYSFTLFDSASLVNQAHWQAVNGHQLYLDLRFLTIAERSTWARLSCRYVIVYRNRQPCGVIYYQVTDFRAGIFGTLMRQEVESLKDRRKNLFERYLEANSEEVLMRLFTCGNNLVSGEYGFHFNDINTDDAQELVWHITDTIAREEHLRGTISAILIKDFHRPVQTQHMLASRGYSPFKVEPNMMLEVAPGINSLEDYISQFSKKYRNRARSIWRSFENITIRNLTADEIALHQSEIFRLYESVFEGARFKLLLLPHDYFHAMKIAFPEQFHVNGIFEGDKLVAFTSGVSVDKKTLDAHYIGLDYSRNQDLNLYQNILYLFIRDAIAMGKSTVNLGRTAAEMKSTVGARAADLTCYIKPQNPISKIIQRTFISYLQPKEMTLRNPFRTAPE